MNKILCIQISTNLINGKLDLNDISQRYYDTLYKIKEKQGYYKGPDFWESPLWITEINYNTPVDFYTCTDIQKTVDYLLNNDYTYVCFSVLDVNKSIILDIIDLYNDLIAFDSDYITHSTFILGGYIDFNKLGENHKFVLNNIVTFKSIKDFIEYLGLQYKQGYNYKLLPRIFKAIKEYNKDFEGFIIQTTTTAFNKLDNGFIVNAHIKYVELGIESFNNSILRKYHKPSSEKTTIEACEKIRIIERNNNKFGIIQLIPNIIIGMLEETTDTYLRTLYFLYNNKDIISHLNIYNLAIYENTALADRIKPSNSNNNELKVNTSKQHHVNFYNHVHKFAIDVLKGV